MTDRLEGIRQVATPAGDIDVAFDGPQDAPAVLVLGHGAGAGLDSEFMVTIAEGLATRGLAACRFNFPYIQRGRKSPDKQAVLEESFRRVVQAVREHFGARPLVLGGKSLGGRIASHIVATGAAAEGLVFLGYPLHPPGKPDRLRVAHLKAVDLPMLFVEGTRDPFCPLPTLERVLEGFGHERTRVVVIEDGDHSLKVRRSSGRSTRQAWEQATAAVGDWVDEVIIAND